MNPAQMKVIYINWGEGIEGRGGGGGSGGGDSPSNTDMKQHFLYLIINMMLCAHTLCGVHIIFPLNNDF